MNLTSSAPSSNSWMCCNTNTFIVGHLLTWNHSKALYAPLLDFTEFAPRTGRIVALAVLFIEQPLGKLPAVLRRQRALALRPARHVFGRFLAAQARFRLLVHGLDSARIL